MAGAGHGGAKRPPISSARCVRSMDGFIVGAPPPHLPSGSLLRIGCPGNRARRRSSSSSFLWHHQYEMLPSPLPLLLLLLLLLSTPWWEEGDEKEIQRCQIMGFFHGRKSATMFRGLPIRACLYDALMSVYISNIFSTFLQHYLLCTHLATFFQHDVATRNVGKTLEKCC